MQVRAATPDELDACAALYARVAAETFTWRSTAEMTPNAFLKQAAAEEVYVAVEDGQVAGLLALYRPDAFIHSLFVDGRSRGVGRALLEHVEGLDPRRRLSLKVESANQRAVAFYKREGFRRVGRGVDAYGEWLLLRREKAGV